MIFGCAANKFTLDKYKNKYRTKPARAQWWNYADEGIYFITICSFKRECLFGDIIDRKMELTPIGHIVISEWEKSFTIRPELFCDAFVLMPDHLHSILRIDHSNIILINSAESYSCAILHSPSSKSTGIAYRPPRSISSFVAGFKSAATKKIKELRQIPFLPVWQRRFYDHIIRNETEYQRIRQYIINNPEKWNNSRSVHP